MLKQIFLNKTVLQDMLTTAKIVTECILFLSSDNFQENDVSEESCS